MRNLILFFLVFLFPAMHAQSRSDLIKADNPNYAYIGRFDFSDRIHPVFMYSGCRIRTVFEGTYLELVMDDDSLRNFFTVIIDKNISVLHTVRKDGHYIIADNLSSGIHTFEIIRRTEWHGGNTTFSGIILEKGRTIFKPEIKERKIEFIGNSYTCGYGNEGKSRNEPFRYETENNYMTYGAIAARDLDAEYLMVCRSGIGMYQGYGGHPEFNMPAFYDEVVLNCSQMWDYKMYQPQVVVIDLGGNDLSAELDSGKFINAYIDFLARLRKNYESAIIVCIAGPSSEGDEWQKWRRLIHSIVDKVITTDPEVHYFEFSPFVPDGSDWHPNVEQHTMMAAELTLFLEVLTGWQINY